MPPRRKRPVSDAAVTIARAWRSPTLKGVISAFIPAMLLAGAVQDDLSNWNPYPAYAVVCVFIFGFFVMSWCSENGPPRPGRGVLERGAR